MSILLINTITDGEWSKNSAVSSHLNYGQKLGNVSAEVIPNKVELFGRWIQFNQPPEKYSSIKLRLFDFLHELLRMVCMLGRSCVWTGSWRVIGFNVWGIVTLNGILTTICPHQQQTSERHSVQRRCFYAHRFHMYIWLKLTKQRLVWFHFNRFNFSYLIFSYFR